MPEPLKTDRIVITIYCDTLAQKEIIEQAAAQEGRSVSNFTLRELLKIARRKCSR
jgi:uncharacterized protein (DUF1778 family)